MFTRSMGKMYTYELPYEINRDLCRLLDFKDCWKDLAGVWMKYSPFEIRYIEQTAQWQERSPTDYLLQIWGQEVHQVEELFLFLYKMKHLQALHCLKPVVKKDFHRKVTKLAKMEKENEMDMEISRNGISDQKYGSTGSIPWVVRKFGMGESLPNTLSLQNVSMDHDSTDFRETSSETNAVTTNEITRQAYAVPIISYAELEEATDMWSRSNLLGSGGYGEVFKGEWKHSTVAVKRLLKKNDRNEENIREMCLNQYRHDNILPLYGYSLGGSHECILYQYMPEGSLFHRLKRKTDAPLTWLQRYNIMYGVAKGLVYLHTMKPALIHGDIKPANILLDGNLTPKIGDFGAATIYTDKMSRKNISKARISTRSSKPVGTWPYLPPEYLSKRDLTPAVDVFSYGVVTLEVATALSVLDESRSEKLLIMHIRKLQAKNVDMASLEDPVLRGSDLSSPALCRAFIAFGLYCTKFSRHERPTMLDVHMQLDKIKESIN